jgi:hypothetical protein
MVDAVAGSVVSNQLQTVPKAVVAQKVSNENTEASVKTIEEDSRRTTAETNGRGSRVDIRA